MGTKKCLEMGEGSGDRHPEEYLKTDQPVCLTGCFGLL